MRKSNVAEWILALVMAPDRATTTVGDLVEASARRGTGWFWVEVCRTALALFWRDLRAEPTRMARLALFGIFLWLVFFVVFVIGMGIFGGLAVFFLHVLGLPDFPAHPPEWPAQATGFIVGGFAIPFQIGRMLARRSPGRELAPCIAFAILMQIVGMTVGSALMGRDFLWQGAMTLPNRIAGLGIALAVGAPMFAGAILVRRRSLRIPHA